MANSKSGKPAAKKPTSKQERGKKGQKVRKATKAKGSKN